MEQVWLFCVIDDTMSNERKRILFEAMFIAFSWN